MSGSTNALHSTDVKYSKIAPYAKSVSDLAYGAIKFHQDCNDCFNHCSNSSTGRAPASQASFFSLACSLQE